MNGFQRMNSKKENDKLKKPVIEPIILRWTTESKNCRQPSDILFQRDGQAVHVSIMVTAEDPGKGIWWFKRFTYDIVRVSLNQVRILNYFETSTSFKH